jgi:hypothetical protein
MPWKPNQLQKMPTKLPNRLLGTADKLNKRSLILIVIAKVKF